MYVSVLRSWCDQLKLQTELFHTSTYYEMAHTFRAGHVSENYTLTPKYGYKLTGSFTATFWVIFLCNIIHVDIWIVDRVYTSKQHHFNRVLSKFGWPSYSSTEKVFITISSDKNCRLESYTATSGNSDLIAANPPYNAGGLQWKTKEPIIDKRTKWLHLLFNEVMGTFQ
jgi:hypothetical protein